MKLKALRDARAQIVARGQAAVAVYANDNREPTAEELAAVKAISAERQAIDGQIEAAEELQSIERGFAVADTVRISGGGELIENDPRGGFKSFGEFAQAVKVAAAGHGMADPRLRGPGAAPTTTQNENTGSDLGFLVPMEYSKKLHTDAQTDDALLPMTDETRIEGNSMTFPASENHGHTSGGIEAYWDGEGSQLQQSRDTIKEKTLRLKRLTALVPMTDELMSDATALSSFIGKRTSEAMRWKINSAILGGDGVGKPLGVIGHAGTVSVAKESAQDAASIVVENLTKMYSRSINPMQSVWMANLACFPQLYDMKDNSGNRVYQTGTPGMASGFAGVLLGRPLMFVEACETIGTVGDLVFGNLKQYQSLTKAGGVETATSIHLWFDYATTAFRAIMRIDGQPWRGTALSPGKGSATRGNFVTLATRS